MRIFQREDLPLPLALLYVQVDPLPLCSSCFLPHIPEEFRGISTSDPVLCSSRMGFQTQPAPRHAWSLSNWPRVRAERAEERLTPPFWTLFWPVVTIVGCLLSHTPAVLQIQSFTKVSRADPVSISLTFKNMQHWLFLSTKTRVAINNSFFSYYIPDFWVSESEYFCSG